MKLENVKIVYVPTGSNAAVEKNIYDARTNLANAVHSGNRENIARAQYDLNKLTQGTENPRRSETLNNYVSSRRDTANRINSAIKRGDINGALRELYTAKMSNGAFAINTPEGLAIQKSTANALERLGHALKEESMWKIQFENRNLNNELNRIPLAPSTSKMPSFLNITGREPHIFMLMKLHIREVFGY